MIVMKYEGIQGELILPGFQGCIELTSFAWPTTRKQSGHGGSVEPSLPDIGNVVVTKQQDQTSGQLLDQLLKGTEATVTISFLRTATAAKAYAVYKLSKTMVVSFSTSSGGDRPVETIGLHFVKFEVAITAMDDALQGVPDRVSYDRSVHG